MEQLIAQFADQLPYIVILGTLLLTGLGLPVPEDVPLVLAGYLAGQGYVSAWVMFPACFLAIVGADAMIFALGRRYGYHIPRMPLLRRFLTEPRLARTEKMLNRHGGKFIFMARFLPGLRTASFFTAGTFKLPYWKFFLYDGSAAALSVPVFLLLSFVFANQIEHVKQWIAEGQFYAIVGVIVVAGLFFLVKWLLKRRFEPPTQGRESP